MLTFKSGLNASEIVFIEVASILADISSSLGINQLFYWETLVLALNKHVWIPLVVSQSKNTIAQYAFLLASANPCN